MRRRRGAIAALAMLAAATAAGCGAAATAHQATITGRIGLDRPTVRAGEKLRAALVLHNSSGRTRILDRGCPHGFVQLTLSRVPPGNGNATAGGFWALPACSNASFVAHPGTTRYQLAITADYGACLMPDGKSLTPMVHCLQPGNRPPPLPVGTYRVAIAAADRHLQHELAGVRSVDVKVLPTRG